MVKRKRARKKETRIIVEGRAYINATFNNTITTFTDAQGNVIAQSSAGAAGFKGSRKSTAYAAQLSAAKATTAAMSYGMRSAAVYIKGPGNGRETALRAIQNTGIRVVSIKDITPIPHNGCRPPKKRRG